MFIHLNVHSQFSPMRGTASQQALISAARKQHMSHLALTEVNGLWGFIRFVQHCHAANIAAIAGANVITAGHEFVLLVENQRGYENLCRILSAVHENAALSPDTLLDQRTSGLFVLAHREDTLRRLAALVPDTHLFVELRPGVEERAAR